MASELKFQTEIIRSLAAQGGHGMKLSHRYSSGVPDLLATAKLGSFLFEAKDLGEVGEKFDRLTGVTPLQQETMRRFNAASTNVMAVQLVHMVDRGERRAVVWPANMNRIDSDYRWRDIWVSRQRSEPKWDVLKLMQMATLLDHTMQQSMKF
jgi:hypothetical protein